MDDLFFNDDSNSRKKRPNGRIHDTSDPTNDDLYSESVFSQGGNDKFKVNIPHDETDTTFTDLSSHSRSRTPNGRPVGSPDNSNLFSSEVNSRTPKGRPVFESGASYHTPDFFDTSERTYDTYLASSPSGGKTPNRQNRSPSYPGRTPVRPQNRTNKKPGAKKPNGQKASGKKKPMDQNKKKAVIAASVFGVIAVLILALFAYGYSILGKINYDADSLKENQYISEKELYSNPNVQNILLIGSDARSEIQGMRSDTMMLFSIDKKNKQIKLTSFLRDSYVCIPSTGHWRKLNAACSAGGAQLVIDTIEYNFKVKIDSYVLADFEVFKKLIDLMGGLTVHDVTAEEAKYLRDKVKIVYAKEGTNKFSGAAALWYCRIRYLDDDFHRTQRQRKVISAIIDQAKGMNPFELVKILEQVLPMITTDINRNDMLSLGLNAVFKYSRYDIKQHQIPAKGTWSNAKISGVGDVLKMDIDENVSLLKDFLSSKQEDEVIETTKKK